MFLVRHWSFWWRWDAEWCGIDECVWQLFVVAHDVCGELLEQLQADLTRRVHLDELEDAEAPLGVLRHGDLPSASPASAGDLRRGRLIIKLLNIWPMSSPP